MQHVPQPVECYRAVQLVCVVRPQASPQLLYLFLKSAMLLGSLCALCSDRAGGLLDLAVHAVLLPGNPVLAGSDAPLQLLDMLL